jgi:hypothetical protein
MKGSITRPSSSFMSRPRTGASPVRSGGAWARRQSSQQRLTVAIATTCGSSVRFRQQPNLRHLCLPWRLLLLRSGSPIPRGRTPRDEPPLQSNRRAASPKRHPERGFFVIEAGARSLSCESVTKRRHQKWKARRHHKKRAEAGALDPGRCAPEWAVDRATICRIQTHAHHAAAMVGRYIRESDKWTNGEINAASSKVAGAHSIRERFPPPWRVEQVPGGYRVAGPIDATRVRVCR